MLNKVKLTLSIHMNYKKHYDLLISRGKQRKFDGYIEYHHIIPKCIGGSDDLDNIVALTPEEHYVAHQLLVKIYNKNYALIKAAAMMCCGRKSNKLYGWIRRKLSKAMSAAQRGEKNSQYGYFWIHNKQLKISKKVPKTHILESGWELGRIIDWNKVPDRKKDEYLDDKREESKKLAYELYNQFLTSNELSVTAFAKSIKTSQPRLTMLWKKYVVEYNEIKQQGKTFKKSIKE